jgi:hypothetical protein
MKLDYMRTMIIQFRIIIKVACAMQQGRLPDEASLINFSDLTSGVKRNGVPFKNSAYNYVASVCKRSISMFKSLLYGATESDKVVHVAGSGMRARFVHLFLE